MKHRTTPAVSESSKNTEDKQAEDIKESKSVKAEIHQNKSPNSESLAKFPKIEPPVSSTPPPERRTVKIEYNGTNGAKDKTSVALENQQKKNDKIETPEKKQPKSNCADVTANKCAGGHLTSKTFQTFGDNFQKYLIYCVLCGVKLVKFK